MPTSTKATRLRPGFSAFVFTTDQVVVNTLAGPVPTPREVHVEAGGELPANLADGEYDRLAARGAFRPVPSWPAPGSVLSEPMSGQEMLNVAPGNEPSTTPGLRVPTAEEQAARDVLAKAQEDVRNAVEQAASEALAGDDVDTPAPRAKK